MVKVSIILLCDAMCKHGTSRWLAILYYIQTGKDIVRLFSWPGSPIILILCFSGIREFKANPSAMGAKYTGYEKLALINQYLDVSWKRYKIGP